jgi:hypothetical protein
VVPGVGKTVLGHKRNYSYRIAMPQAAPYVPFSRRVRRRPRCVRVELMPSRIWCFRS